MAEQDVRIRISVPTVDASAIDALVRKNRALEESLEALTQAAKGVPGATTETPVRRPQGQGVPAPPPVQVPPAPRDVQRPQGQEVPALPPAQARPAPRDVQPSQGPAAGPAPSEAQPLSVDIPRPRSPVTPAPIEVQHAQVEVQAGARVEVQQPQEPETPPPTAPPRVAPAPDRNTLQQALHAVQLQEGQVDMQTGSRLLDELRRKRQDLERQIAHLQQSDRGTQRQERLDRPGEEPTPAPTRAPVSPQIMEGRQLRLEAMKARLQGLETRREALRPDHYHAFGRYRLDTQIAGLTARITQLGQVIRETPAAAAEPGTDLPAAQGRGGGRRPPRPPQPPGGGEPQDPQSAPDDGGADHPAQGRGARLAGAVVGGAGRMAATVGRSALGVSSLAGVGAVAGAAVLGGSSFLSELLDGMGRYEQRVRAVGILNRQMAGGYREVNATLDTMRDRYKQLARETFELIEGVRETGEVAPAAIQKTVEAATGAAVALGLAPRTAGALQGRFQRVFAPRPDRDYPLVNVGMAQQRYGYRGLTNEQFLEQVGQIGSIGGYNLPTMSMDTATRMANFVGGMGQRFVGQQANFLQELAANVAPSGNPLTEALRHRAVARLAGETPGGILTIGAGEDAEQLNIRASWRDRLKAMEMAPQSPQMWEAYAREGERLGMGQDETLEMMRVALAPGMSRFAFDRLARERQKQGGSFTTMAKDLGETIATGGGKAVAQKDILTVRMSEDEPFFTRLNAINATMEKGFEHMGSGLAEFKVFLQEKLVELVSSAAPLYADFKNVMTTLNTTLGAVQGVLETFAGTPAAPGEPAPYSVMQDLQYWQQQRLNPSPTTPHKAR